jgi:hypothetical protein
MNRKLSVFGIALAFAAGIAVASLRPVSADQPHMQNALKNLKQAREDLEKATPDKGGHRVKALELTNQAIEEVTKGIEFDRRH